MIKPIKAWAVVKGGKLDALEIYEDKDVELSMGERLIRVTITADEENIPKGKKPASRKRKQVCKSRS
jgi:hypothetical protein